MDRVKFKINDVEYSVGCEVDSNTTLLGFIRKKLELYGTKYMCLEAGCGACIVSAIKSPGENPQSINSCMVSITSCQDWDITTIEKIGNRLDGYHPIQLSLAENNGTQCGYCSPGWVMAMYSLWKNKKMTMLEIEQSFGSNVCRCTGYRPIMDAFKKFASDAPFPNEIPDIEDLKICNSSGNICDKNKCEDSEWCFVKREEVKCIHLKDNHVWYRVESIDDVFDIWNKTGLQSYMLVAGNTGKGVVPILEYPITLIDISELSELKGFYIDQNLVLGAGNTLTETMNIFDALSNYDYFSYLKILNEHLQLVAHIPVRNLGTLAGNLMVKNQNIEFQSDVFLLLETVGAELVIVTAPEQQKILSMLDFLKEDMRGKIIKSILMPPLNASHKLVTYKILPRSQNAHAIVHSGYIYKLDDSGVVIDCRIVYGGLAPLFIRATNTEQYLIGKPLFLNETLQSALQVLNKEIVVIEHLPEYPVLYRRDLALCLFYKGLLSLYPNEKLNPRYHSGAVKIHETRPVSKGLQNYSTDPPLWPLTKPSPKFDALIQCAGEARYTEDLPSFVQEVYAAFVLTTVPRGTIDSIDPSRALMEPGVVAFYSASDIRGINTFVSPKTFLFPRDEELLCDGEVRFYNQPLGIVVAEEQKIAEKAAALVQVKYSNIKEPVYDIQLAKLDSKRLQFFRSIDPKSSGTNVFKIINGENTIYAQYHFCMETLVCVAYPTEEGLKIHAATQWQDTVNQVTSRLLKLDQNRIDVFVRRTGGGYGYKISRSTQVHAACAFVTSKLNRPCRFIQTLTNNMRAIGKRLPCSANYEIAVSQEGVIQYLKIDVYSDNGCIINEPLINLGYEIYSNLYNADTWSGRVYNVYTDTPSNSWCRSPGTLEFIAMTEALMERIAYELNLDPLYVRLSNLDTNYNDILEMLETLKINSEYEKRKIEVDQFNLQNRWNKRGLRFSLMRWKPFGGLYLDINISVYNDDGSVAITHGGVEIGQGINTRAIQVCAYCLNIPVEKIQIKPNDSFNSTNNSATGGSITNQNVTIGIQRACAELLKRLEPVRQQLNNPTWEQLIKRAFELEVDLQVHGFVRPGDDVLQDYNIYGITLAEVEIDVLTGESEIIRVDLIEDVGRSVNPELDVGQVEGAFIMSVGYWTSERLVYEPKTGELLTNRTWEYWVPQARDIPQDFRVYFRKRSYSKDIILGAKATGEPATCMGIVIAFALRHAIASARLESGIPVTEWFQIDGPHTIDKVQQFCATKIEDFKFY